jgi:hypothetical protein
MMKPYDNHLGADYKILCGTPAREVNDQKQQSGKFSWSAYLHAHWLQILQQIKPMDKVKQYNVCCNFLEKLHDDDDHYQQAGCQ